MLQGMQPSGSRWCEHFVKEGLLSADDSLASTNDGTEQSFIRLYECTGSLISEKHSLDKYANDSFWWFKQGRQMVDRDLPVDHELYHDRSAKAPSSRSHREYTLTRAFLLRCSSKTIPRLLLLVCIIRDFCSWLKHLCFRVEIDLKLSLTI